MKIKNILITGIASVALAGCNDSFMERYPEAINDATFWNTPEDLKTYTNRFYTLLPGGVNSIADGESDDQVPNSRPSFFWNEYPVPASGGSWAKSDWLYIRQLNYFMTHYNKVVASEADVNKYVAEVRFFRAQQYGGKIRTFGDVPWLEKELATNDKELYGSKMKRDLVMDKMVEDFDFAIKWLPETPEVGRIGKDVARLLKARTCLHEGTYYRYHKVAGLDEKSKALIEMAAKEAGDIIATHKYEIYKTGKPLQDYYKMFVIEDKSTLKEAILPVTYITDVRTHGMSRTLGEANTGFSKDFVKNYLCSDGKPISLSDKYLGDLSIDAETTDRDPRLKQTILTPDFPRKITAAGDSSFIKEENLISQYCYTGYNVIKYFSPLEKDLEANANTYDGIAYRYAEALLIYAEAKAELGTITQTDLDNTVNQLRDRVGMPHMLLEVGFVDPDWTKWGYDLSPLLQEIRRERRVELAGEGFRWDDLMRWNAGAVCDETDTYTGMWVAKDNKYAEVYPGFFGKRKWDNRLYLRPIPTGEILKNPNLKPQNPGWEQLP